MRESFINANIKINTKLITWDNFASRALVKKITGWNSRENPVFESLYDSRNFSGLSLFTQKKFQGALDPKVLNLKECKTSMREV